MLPPSTAEIDPPFAPRRPRPWAGLTLMMLALSATPAAALVAVTPPDFELTVLDIIPAPDQIHVAFVARGVSDDGPGRTVWWARLDGTVEPRRLSGALEDVDEVVISPDSRRVAFNAFEAGVLEVWTAPVDAGAPVRISSPSPDGRASSIAFSDDGSRVLYVQGPNGGNRRLWTAPADGGSFATSISEADDNLSEFRIAAQGRVIYRVFQPDVARTELFAAPVGGGASVRLSLSPGPPAPGGEELVAIPEWSLSPDRTTVVYTADMRFLGDPDNDAVDSELYAVPAAGSSGLQTRLDFDESIDRQTLDDTTHEFAISSDGRRVVFLYSQEAEVPADSINDHFYVTAIDGGSAPVLLADDSAAIIDFKASVEHAAYRSSDLSLVSMPFVGGAVTLDGDPVNADYRPTPDGRRAVYSTGQERALWSRRLDGAGPPAALTPPLGFGAVLADFAVTPQSSHVLFRSDFEIDGLFELYAVETAGGTARKLNDPPVTGRRVGDVVATSDDRCVLFNVAASSSAPNRLFAADLGGPCAVAPGIFADGFESGDTSAWSVSSRSE